MLVMDTKKPFFMAFSLTVSVPASYETSVCPESTHVRFSVSTQGGEDRQVSFLIFLAKSMWQSSSAVYLLSQHMMDPHTHVYVLNDRRRSLTDRRRRIFKNGNIFLVMF